MSIKLTEPSEAGVGAELGNKKLLRVKISSLGKYKHLKGKSKYLKGENHQKVKKVRKLQAKKTHKNKKFLRLDFEHC